MGLTHRVECPKKKPRDQNLWGSWNGRVWVCINSMNRSYRIINKMQDLLHREDETTYWYNFCLVRVINEHELVDVDAKWTHTQSTKPLRHLRLRRTQTPPPRRPPLPTPWCCLLTSPPAPSLPIALIPPHSSALPFFSCYPTLPLPHLFLPPHPPLSEFSQLTKLLRLPTPPQHPHSHTLQPVLPLHFLWNSFFDLVDLFQNFILAAEFLEHECLRCCCARIR